jgi:hypothetical protein
MVEDELPAAFEEIAERHRTVLPLEDIGLLDLHHRQRPALGAQCVALPGRRLLLDQQGLARL